MCTRHLGHTLLRLEIGEFSGCRVGPRHAEGCNDLRFNHPPKKRRWCMHKKRTQRCQCMYSSCKKASAVSACRPAVYSRMSTAEGQQLILLPGSSKPRITPLAAGSQGTNRQATDQVVQLGRCSLADLAEQRMNFGWCTCMCGCGRSRTKVKKLCHACLLSDCACVVTVYGRQHASLESATRQCWQRLQ